MKPVLIVVHDHPPIRSTGSLRMLKFAQYLPEFGYRAVFLTTNRYGGLPTDAIGDIYRANDFVHSIFSPLRRKRGAGTIQEQQFRIATLESSSILGRLRDRIMIPDTKLGWLLPAIQVGRRAIAEQQPILILSSSPPETPHLIAAQLACLSGLPWVADFRDGWLFEPPNPAMRQAWLRRWLEGRLERSIVLQATALTTAQAPLADDFRARYPRASAEVRTVTNGYDAAEFAGLNRQRKPDGTFLLVHTGALSGSRQGTSPSGFFRALSDVARQDPATPLRVRMVGDTNPRERAEALSLGLGEYVTFIPPVSNREAHQHQLDADALLLITARRQRSIAPLKLYDYIGAGVPILALAQDNVAAGFVHSYGLGITAPPDDPLAIASALSELMQLQREGTTWPGFATARLRFERRALTGELASLFDRILSTDEL